MDKKKIVWLFKEKRKIRNEYSSSTIWYYGILENLGYDVVYHPYEDYNADEFYYSVKDYKPDFVIHPTYNKIHTELIRIREFSKLYILQSDDRWRYDNYSKFWIPFIDGVITYEGEADKYKEDGLDLNNFCRMRWAFNPNTMCSDDKNTGDILLSHTGGLHGDRQEKLQELLNRKLELLVENDLTYEQAKHIWSNSKYSLCFTMNSLKTMRELKGRVVEIPNFCALLTEPFPEIEDYYKEDEIILFNDVDELIEKVDFYENNTEEYNKIVENGKRALWNRNTAYHEWNKILTTMDEDYEPINVIELLKAEHGDFYYD